MDDILAPIQLFSIIYEKRQFQSLSLKKYFVKNKLFGFYMVFPVNAILGDSA